MLKSENLQKSTIEFFEFFKFAYRVLFNIGY